ncbi:anti-sigma factor family protein [Allorhodopirellula heiligendammensis]|uniref:DUF1559 domain-containing protein n=1 Tax=Allorhodopirellula heiligendammensis TaxID=2714739 RepID=A0A5C6C523_9BACT|nr:DUF1559 domain-containing protein [Allorhodopirellula heiligendammensis]TWU19663.1 hypothetical protein Poly21_18380 [Allorhodopirellula heiligendammensis]
MQEDLLGYLLGALEPDEMRRVEQWLREDAEARRELAELERVLKRLEEADGFVEEQAPSPADLTPPADLVSRTLANLPPLPPFNPSANPEKAEQNEADSENEVSDSDWELPHASAQVFSDLSLSSTHEESGAQSWNLRDWGASVVAAIILLAIALPMLFEGRFAARKIACQNNLRELGVAMTQYADRNAQSRLPSVAPTGYQAFAGIYALLLHEAGLLDRPQQTLCPSIGTRRFEAVNWPLSLAPQEPSVAQRVPPMFVTLETLDEVGRELSLARSGTVGEPGNRHRLRLAIDNLHGIQMKSGGHYSYTLGVRDEGRFSSPRFESRSRFAVMSDAVIVRTHAPNPTTASHASYRFNVISHGGRGINLLYEDGHVGFIPSGSLDRIPDNPLVNHEGLLEAGVTVDDASLGPSWQPPFIHASQR